MADQNHTTDASSLANGGSDNLQQNNSNANTNPSARGPDDPLPAGTVVPRRQETESFHQQTSQIEAAEVALAQDRRNRAISASGLPRPPPGREYHSYFFSPLPILELSSLSSFECLPCSVMVHF